MEKIIPVSNLAKALIKAFKDSEFDKDIRLCSAGGSHGVCIGVYMRELSEMLRLGGLLSMTLGDEADEAFNHASIDDMGRGFIVYWRGAKAKQPSDGEQ